MHTELSYCLKILLLKVNTTGSNPAQPTKKNINYYIYMLDKNIVLLEGLIGDDYRYGKTQDAKEYATFSLCINSFIKDMADSTERTHSQAFIRIFVYDKKQVEYLHKVNAHRGQRASVFGRLVSFMSEHKGNRFMVNNVVCRDIQIIKTKEEKD